MKPPTLKQIQDYIHFKGFRHVDAEILYNYYESIGWKVGRNPMKNWRSAVSGWNAREKKKGTPAKAREVLCRNCGSPATGSYGTVAHCHDEVCHRAAGDTSYRAPEKIFA